MGLDKFRRGKDKNEVDEINLTVVVNENRNKKLDFDKLDFDLILSNSVKFRKRLFTIWQAYISR